MKAFDLKPIHKCIASSALSLAVVGGAMLLKPANAELRSVRHQSESSEQQTSAIQSVIVQGETLKMMRNWNTGYSWNNGYMWNSSLTKSASVNTWVDQE